MNRRILYLAIPNILSNLSIPLLGMVDTALMGHLDSPVYLGAVGIGGTIFSFLYWSMGFLRMGTTGLAAQAYGQKDQQQLARILIHAAFVALASSLLFILFQIPINNFALGFFPAEQELLEKTSTYFYVRIWAAPATIGLYALNGWFLGMQNARIPLIITLIANLGNIILSYLFVRIYGWGIAGVASATAIAQYLGLGTALVLMYIHYKKDWVMPSRAYLTDLGALKKFLFVNGDIFIRTVCLIFVFAFFTVKSTTFGTAVLAANQVLRQFLDMMAYGVDGFAFAAESLVGRYFGEKKQEKLNQALRLLFIWGVGLGALFSMLFWILGNNFLSFFTNQEEVIEIAKVYLPWQYLLPLVASIAFMLDGAYLGATASRPMRNMMLLSTFGVFLPAWYLGEETLGNHALWLAIFLFMLVRAISLGVVTGKYLRIENS
ncbi:MAG: MATE family efflux transporter [Bacteroidia bacterium]|nr:MATE family efflux transporter [Bacteroidia bacterium]